MGRGISMLCPSDEIRRFILVETIKSKIRECRTCENSDTRLPKPSTEAGLNSVQPLHYCGKEFCHFVALILWFRFLSDLCWTSFTQCASAFRFSASSATLYSDILFFQFNQFPGFFEEAVIKTAARKKKFLFSTEERSYQR